MGKNWAELPRGLLGRIMKKMCIESIDSFKMVCHPWFSALQEEAILSLVCPAPSPPWLTVPQSGSEFEAYDDDDKDKDKCLSARFFNPTNNKVYFFQKEEMKRWLPHPSQAVCVGSSHGWLAFIDTRCVIYLVNPFKKSDIKSNKYMIQLPSIETLPCILGVECERSSPSDGGGGGGGSIIIDFVYWNYYEGRSYTSPSNDTYEYFITKLVVSSDSDYTVMAIYGELHDLAFCKSGDKSWTPLNKDTRPPVDHATRSRNNATVPLEGSSATLASYEDIHYSSNDQCFYAYRHTGSIEIWDLGNPSSPKCTCIDLPLMSSVVPPSLTSHEKWLRSWCSPKMYLVNFYGDLLLVVKYIAEEVTEDGQIYTNEDENRYPYKTLRFDVYKLDWVQKQWVHVKYLGNGDGVLFVGINNAMTFSACDFPALRGNSIYFTDDIFDLRPSDGPYGGHDLGIFSLEDNSIHPCFYPAMDFKRISPPPVWLAPNPW